MEIRTGRAADHAAALEVYRVAQAARGRRPTKERLQRVAAKLADERLVVVEETDGKVIAMALSEPARAKSGRGAPIPTALHLSMLFVAPGWQRQGVGAALVDGLADLAWADGFRTVGVWTESPDFYLACGFTVTGQRQTRDDGRNINLLRADLEPPTREVVVGPAGIRLGQLLKLAGLVDTGSEAKARLAAGEVTVNGEVDTRRGRQLDDGDEIGTANEIVVVRTGAEEADYHAGSFSA